MISDVSETRLRDSIQHLTSYPTRFSTSAQFFAASEWAYRKLANWGYHCSWQNISMPGGWASRNVIAELNCPADREAPQHNILLVVAHIDSIIGTFDKPFIDAAPVSSCAPGADDNASGCASLLEVARIVADIDTKWWQVRFILTGAEETGAFGSKAYVANLTAAERQAILAAINIDQIGRRRTEEPTVLLETNREYELLADCLEASAQDHTNLNVDTCFKPWGGDHLIFLRAGIPTVLTIEGKDEMMHSTADREEFIDYELVAEITKMNLGLVLYYLADGEGREKHEAIHRLMTKD